MFTLLGPIQYPTWLRGGNLDTVAVASWAGLPDAPVTGSFVFVLANGGVASADVAGRGWDLPGGRVEHGEHPLDAAVRATREQTGVELDTTALRLIGAHRIRNLSGCSDPARALMTFSTVVLRERCELRPGNGTGDARWFEWCDVLELGTHRAWGPLLRVVAATCPLRQS